MKQYITQNEQGNISENLKLLRRRAHLKQWEVAARLQLRGFNISREIYAQMEMGRHRISVPVLWALQEIFHASWNELMDPVGGEQASG